MTALGVLAIGLVQSGSRGGALAGVAGLAAYAVVVTRYFGGTKLGTGGLVRAYSGAAQAVLETLPTIEAVEKLKVDLQVAFEHEQALRHQLEQLHLPIGSAEYGNKVCISTDIPIDEFESTARQLKGALPHGSLKLIK